MKRRTLLAGLPAALLGAGVSPRPSHGFCQSAGAQGADSTPGPPRPLGPIVEPFRARHDLPAMAAAVLFKGRLAGVGAVGVRKHGHRTPVTIHDRFHIGSCTKSMTATLLAVLVEQGRTSWDVTLPEAFPELADSMHPGWRSVTLTHLLCHRAGFPSRSTPQGKSLLDMHRLPGPPRRQREAYVRMVLREAPEAPPGERYVYANMGYAVAGAIAERAGGASWEELMGRHLFRPLGMTSAGFGAPGRSGAVDQPLQHVLENGRRRAIEPGPFSDNPDVIGPGGKVHCSVGDWSRYVAAHLAGPRGPEDAPGNLLRPETWKKLHTPPFGGDYAFGWIVTERDWGGGRVLTHAGSNTMNFAVVWMAPLRDFAVMVATNQGGDAAATACDQVAATLIGHFL